MATYFMSAPENYESCSKKRKLQHDYYLFKDETMLRINKTKHMCILNPFLLARLDAVRGASEK